MTPTELYWFMGGALFGALLTYLVPALFNNGSSL